MRLRHFAAGACIILTSCRSAPPPANGAPAAAVDATGTPARILSAFFGLDNALPDAANRLCPGAAGRDGMPIVLSHTIDPDTLDREDFRVVTRAGREHTPGCVTLAPATDAGELRTVLLVGELGGADDPPAMVRIVGEILSDGAGGVLTFSGTAAGVIPLEAGPTLALAEVVTDEGWPAPFGHHAGSACPAGTTQVLRVTWTGGVRRPDGSEADDAERLRYRVTVEMPGGARDVVVPFALGDLDDRDNNHRLCLDTSGRPLSVSFPAGHLVDPRGDLNPNTFVEVANSATIGITEQASWRPTRRTPAIRQARPTDLPRRLSSYPRSTTN